MNMLSDPELPAKVCRICLKYDVNMKRSFQSIYIEYLELFPSHMDVLNMSSISMFDSVCFVCYALVKRFHVFSHACRQTQQNLEEIVCGMLNELPKCKPVIDLEVKDCNEFLQLYETTVEVVNETANIKTEDIFDYEDDIPLSDTFLDIDKMEFEDSLPVENVNQKFEADIPKAENTRKGKRLRGPRKNKVLETSEFKVKVLTPAEMVAEFEARKNSKLYMESEFKCDICYQRCLSKYHLSNHIERLHTKRADEDTIQCDICRQYYLRCRRSKHIISHKYIYICKACNSQYQSQRSVMRHYERMHNDAQYVCNLCAKVFKSSSALQEHGYRHTHEKKYQCDYCNRMFIFKRDLCGHIRKHMNPEHKCEKCKRVFLSNSNMLKHICPKDRPRVEKQIGRPRLDRTNSTQNTYCVECDKVFKSERYLMNHFNTKKHGGVQNYKCNQCPMSFNNWIQKRDHVDRDHLNKRFVCEHCGQCLGSHGSYTVHVQRHVNPPPKIRRFLCTICHKKFYTREQLSKHTNTHTGARPYKCKLCEKAFASDATLYSHIKIVHEKIKRKSSYKPKHLRKLDIKGMFPQDVGQQGMLPISNAIN